MVATISKSRSIVLCLMALVYASTASAKATLVGINDVKGGTLLFATKTPGRHIPAPLLATDVEIHVSGPIARVKVRQKFLNPSRHWLEGRYVFPLPQQSAVHHMIMRGKGMEIIAEIKEKEAARKIYRQAQQSGRRAALIEQRRPNIFTTSVANLAPDGTIEVEINYLQQVRYDHGRFHLRFPMVVAPRYTPRGPVRMVNTPGDGAPPIPRPGQPLPKSPVLHPDEGKINPVRLRVRLDAGVRLAALESPHHAIVASDWKDGISEITLAGGVKAADRDFELIWTPRPSAQPTVSLFQERVGEDAFVLAMVLPPEQDQAPAPQPRDVIFVLDKSGSMAGASIRQARAALSFALGRLKPQDRFNVLRFANQTDAVFEGLRTVSRESQRLAVHFVNQTQANGGTNMRPALLRALSGSPADGRLRQIVFLTDAAIGNEAALFDEIAGRIGEQRLFTVGIGSAPNSYFMQRAAELGRGSFTYIGNTQKVGEQMRTLFRKIESPMATGLSAMWIGFAAGDRHIDAYPARLPDLYAGEPVIMAARIKGAAETSSNAVLVLSGRIGGHPWQKTIDLSQARRAAGAGTIWGRARIKDLMMSLHHGAAPDSVRRAVTATALRHKIVSRYTSLIAIEKKITRPADEPIYPRHIPRNLPNGWEFDKVFGDVIKTKAAARDPGAPPPAATPPQLRKKAALRQRTGRANSALVSRAPTAMASQRKSARQYAAAAPIPGQGQAVRLPAGSTSATINLLVGIIALLAGVIVMRRRRTL
ncbi:MAG: marine proteobacterial sortase target protein [Rhodospirillaceae bacterium]|nr:marine proteobacterial sortase target protein [Rhodospirillaceae bacterium]